MKPAVTRVLVSGASGIVGYGVLRSLRATGRALHLVGSSIYDDSVAPAFCDVFEQAPATADSGYLDWLLGTIRKHGIELVVPGIEVDMHTWIEHVPEIRSTGAVPVLNSPSLIALCKDKWLFQEELRAAGLRCRIESTLEGGHATLAHRFGSPFLLKPRQGFGARGIVRVDSAETFERSRAEFGRTLMAQPIVGNDAEEYTISAFCDGEGGYSAAMALRRKLSREGFTEKAEVVDAAGFSATLRQLCAHFHPVGPTNFQFRMCEDGPRLLEINPRISSATSIRTGFGYNESAMALDFFLRGIRPVQPEIRRGRAVRYTEDRFFYEDSLRF